MATLILLEKLGSTDLWRGMDCETQDSYEVLREAWAHLIVLKM